MGPITAGLKLLARTVSLPSMPPGFRPPAGPGDKGKGPGGAPPADRGKLAKTVSDSTSAADQLSAEFGGFGRPKLAGDAKTLHGHMTELAKALNALQEAVSKGVDVETARNEVLAKWDLVDVDKELPGIKNKAKERGYADRALKAGRAALQLTASTEAPKAVIRELDVETLTGLMPYTTAQRLRSLFKKGQPALQALYDETTRDNADTDDADVMLALISLYGPAPERPEWFDAELWASEKAAARQVFDDGREKLKSIESSSALAAIARQVLVAVWWVAQDPSDIGGNKAKLPGLVEEMKAKASDAPDKDSGAAFKLADWAGKLAEIRDDGGGLGWFLGGGEQSGQADQPMRATPPPPRRPEKLADTTMRLGLIPRIAPGLLPRGPYKSPLL